VNKPKNQMSSWNGTWTSSTYPSWYVHGIMSVNLPDNITESYETNVSLIYRGWYRSGTHVVIPALVSRNNVASTNLGPGQLAVRITNIGRDTIEGRYHLSNPIDSGTFVLQKGDFVEQQPPTTICTIQ